MLEYEGIGKNIEKAIEDALFNLKASREDVDIKILEEGGLFKKAKVLVTISEDCKDKFEKKEPKKEISEKELQQDLNSLKNDIKNSLAKETKKEKEISEETEEEIKVEFDSENSKQQLQSPEFIKGVLEKLKISATINVSEKDDKKVVTVEGKNVSQIIGFRGECLNSLQFLLNVIESRKNDKTERIVLDAENYRLKREETLISLAERMARKAHKTNHQVKLEPMNANERRIIHTALQNDTSITTFSKGTEPNRYLVIAPIGEVQDNNI
ncbi:MAG: RNA-binding cell elongation regulator Jag/EloR [Clostridia bacterium]